MTDYGRDWERLGDPRRAGARRIVGPEPVSLVKGVSLVLAEKIRLDAGLSDDQKLQAYRSLPRNRREARALLRGRGPWGLAKKRS